MKRILLPLLLSLAALLPRVAQGQSECLYPTPYLQGFESSSGELPDCWLTVQGSTYDSDNPYPRVRNNSSAAHTGSQCLSLYDGTDSYQERIYNLVATPRFANPERLLLSFWSRAGSSSQMPSLFVVGLVDDTNGFTPYDTIPVTTTYEQHYVRFAGHSGGAARIGFYAARDQAIYSTFMLNLDDIDVELATDCPMPTNFRCTHVGAGEVTLGWAGEGANEWEVAYGPEGFTPGGAQGSLLSQLDTTEAYFDWLSDTMAYDFFVRALCDSVGSAWVGPVTARMGVYEMAATGWDTLYACGMTITDDGGPNGPYSQGCDAFLVVFPEEPNYTIRLRGTVETYSDYYDYLDLYEGVGVTGNYLGRYGGSDGMAVDTVSGVGAMTLHFRAAGQVTEWLRPYMCRGFALEVVCDELADCPRPTGLTIGNITGTTVYASWTPSPSEGAEYLVTVEEVGTALPTYHTCGSPYLLLGGLQPNTTYAVSVQASCLNGYISDLAVDTFTTLCLSGGMAEVGSQEVDNMMIPFTPYYEYSMSQQIFLAAELTQIVDSVLGVSFYNTTPYTDTRFLTIYLDTTSVDTFASAQDYIVPRRGSEVFRGTVQLQPNGWCPITFTMPLAYFGGNLLLTCHDSTGTYVDNTPRFAINNRAWNRSIYRYATQPIDIWTYPAGATADNMTTYTRFTTRCGEFNGCLPPTVHVDEVHSDEVILSWVPGYQESLWSVEYMGEHDSMWTTAESATSQTFADITGLQANTAYQFRVTSLCGGLAGTAYATVSATTPCAPISQLPYLQDFEQFTAPGGEDTLEACWRRISSGFVNFHPYVNTEQSASGSRSLYFDAAFNPYLVLPPLELGLDTVILRAKVMSLFGAGSNSVSVGVMTDPANTNTFNPIGTFALDHLSDRWQELEVSFEHYHGPHGHIALTCGAQCVGFFLDDLQLLRASPCHRVTHPQAATTATTALLSWTDTNSVGSYTLRWGTLDDHALATDSASTSSLDYTLTGLASGQRYYAWVRANCPGEPSWWMPFGPFATACAAIGEVPWQEDFEGYAQGDRPECWQILHAYDEQPCVSTLGGHAYQGSAALFLDAYTYASGGLNTIALPAIASLEGLQLRFAARTLPGFHPESFTAGVLDSAGRYLPIDTIDLYDEWGVYYLYLDRYLGHTGRIAFQARDTNVQGHGRVLMDNFLLDSLASCLVPSRLRVIATSDLSAGLTWREEGEATEWQIAYSTQPLSDPSQGSLVRADSIPFLLTGLQPSTEYYFYLRSVCAPGDTSLWTEPGRRASTHCPATTAFPFAEDFEGNAMPSCWSQEYLLYNNAWRFRQQGAALAFQGSPSESPCTSSHGGQYNAALLHDFSHTTEGTATRLVTPVLDLSGLNEPTLSFWYVQPTLGSDHDQLTLLYRPHPHQEWQLLATYPAEASDWTQQVVALPYPSHEYQLAFEGRDNYGFGIGLDDVEVYEIVVLPCDPVSQVTALEEDHAITLSWPAPATDPSGYLIACGADTLFAAQPPVTIEGLEGNTTYEFRIRTLCREAPDSSLWAGPFAFTTTLPCHTPTSLSATPLDGLSALVEWTPGGEEEEWEVACWGQDFVVRTLTTAQRPLTLEGLYPSVTYRLTLRSRCGAGQAYSPWSDTVAFTMPTCDTARDLAHQSLSPHSVLLSWEGSAQSYTVRWGDDIYLYAMRDSATVASTSCAIEGLEAGKTYYAVVRAHCSEGWNSLLTMPYRFTTDHEGIASPLGSISVFPNPAGDFVEVMSDECSVLGVELYDPQGRLLRSGSSPLSLTGIPSGAYFLKALTDQGPFIRKIVKK